MRYTREEYEKLINECILFDIDKENDFSLFKTEKFKLFTVLADYYRFFVYVKRPLESYSMELIDSANECIKYFDKSRGVPFLHYLNTVLSKNILIAKAKEVVCERRRGMTVSQRDGQLIRKIMAYAKSKNADVWDEVTQQKIATMLNMRVDEVAELIRINQNAIGVDSIIISDDGDEVELFDLQQSREDSIEEKLLQIDEMIGLAVAVDAEFMLLQNRPTTRILLSKILTAKFICGLETKENIDIVLKDKHFVDPEMVAQYIKTLETPTIRQIAKSCEVSEQSTSRTYKMFIEKVKKNC